MTTHRPIYAVPQPDGSEVELDFTLPGPFGDFALGVHLVDGTMRRVGVFHTGEPLLFVDVLHNWARTRSRDGVLDDVAWVRTELETMTAGLVRTTESENDLGWQLEQIRSLTVRSGEVVEPRTYCDEGDNALTLIPTSEGLVLTDELGQLGPITVHLPASALCAVVAGMVWRSYLPRSSAIPLTRLNTVTYLEALDVFESAVRLSHHEQGPTVKFDAERPSRLGSAGI